MNKVLLTFLSFGFGLEGQTMEQEISGQEKSKEKRQWRHSGYQESLQQGIIRSGLIERSQEETLSPPLRRLCEQSRLQECHYNFFLNLISRFLFKLDSNQLKIADEKSGGILPGKIVDMKPSLRVLELKNCQIRYISPKLGNLTELERLNLCENHIQKLPLSLGMLTHLKYLDLSKNQLTELPLEMGNLEQLEHLNLCNNQLQSLPETFSGLKNLRVLSLSSNDLSIVPLFIENFDLLSELHVSFNPRLYIGEEQKKKLKAKLKWFFE